MGWVAGLGFVGEGIGVDGVPRCALKGLDLFVLFLDELFGIEKHLGEVLLLVRAVGGSPGSFVEVAEPCFEVCVLLGQACVDIGECLVLVLDGGEALLLPE
jgi:hypothetical protein